MAADHVTAGRRIALLEAHAAGESGRDTRRLIYSRSSTNERSALTARCGWAGRLTPVVRLSVSHRLASLVVMQCIYTPSPIYVDGARLARRKVPRVPSSPDDGDPE
jgi:hypothetical protein